MDAYVAVRFDNGSKRMFRANDVKDHEEARELIYTTYSSVRVALASVQNTKKD